MLILLNIKVTMSDPSNSNSGLSFLGLDVNLFETTNAQEGGIGWHPVARACHGRTYIVCEIGGSYCSWIPCN